MSNNINKSSLEKARADYEELRKFTQQQIENKLQEEVDKKILDILNEEINISVDEEGNVDITKDGEEVASVNASSEEEVPGENMDYEDEEFIEVSDDEEPIEVSPEEDLNDENMLEMDYMKNEAEAPAPAPTNAAPAPEATPAPEAAPAPELEELPAPEGEEVPGDDSAEAIDELISKMDTLINVLMQQQGVSADQQTGEQEFEVIDDESETAPAPAPEATPAPAEENPAPVQEELTFEIEDFEEGHDILEIVDEEMMEAEEFGTETIVDEYEMTEDEDTMDEMHGVGQNLRHSNRLGKMPRQGVENREELNENKAHYESKIDELIKENEGLKNKLKDLKLERKEFEEAFILLREEFDEMQTFNGKLALANKLLMNGGLSFEQRLNVCEQFDSAETIEEAERIFKSIIKENNIKVNDASAKIKASTTHTAKATTEAKPLYESEEARRMKELAGMTTRSID